jgi:hypothetical protein
VYVLAYVKTDGGAPCPSVSHECDAAARTAYSHRCVFFSIDDSTAALYASRYAAVSNRARWLWLARSRHTTDDTPDVRPTREARLSDARSDVAAKRASTGCFSVRSFVTPLMRQPTCLNVTGQNRATRDAGRRSAWEPRDAHHGAHHDAHHGARRGNHATYS